MNLNKATNKATEFLEESNCKVKNPFVEETVTTKARFLF